MSRLISLLAALWLVGQLAAAFHLGHSDTEGLGASETSCLLCKLAAADDVPAATPLFLSLAVLFFIAATAAVFVARRKAEWRLQARAPPAI